MRLGATKRDHESKGRTPTARAKLVVGNEDRIDITLNVLKRLVFGFRPAVVKETRDEEDRYEGIRNRFPNDVLVIEPKERLTVETEPDFASYFIRLLEAGHRSLRDRAWRTCLISTALDWARLSGRTPQPVVVAAT